MSPRCPSNGQTLAQIYRLKIWIDVQVWSEASKVHSYGNNSFGCDMEAWLICAPMQIRPWIRDSDNGKKNAAPTARNWFSVSRPDDLYAEFYGAQSKNRSRETGKRSNTRSGFNVQTNSANPKVESNKHTPKEKERKSWLNWLNSNWFHVIDASYIKTVWFRTSNAIWSCIFNTVNTIRLRALTHTEDRTRVTDGLRQPRHCCAVNM